MNTLKKLLHITEAAQALNLSVSNMYRLAREGKLPGTVRIGKRWLFDVDAIVQAMMTTQPRKQPQRKVPLPGMPPSKPAVPTMPAPNPDEVMSNARLVLQHAVEAVQQAARVMAAIDSVRHGTA